MHNLPQAARFHPPHRDRLPGRIAVEPVLPVDVLGAYVLLPVLPPVAGPAAGTALHRTEPA